MLVLATAAGAAAMLALVGRMSLELRARAALRAVHARGETVERAELRRRVFDAQ